MSVDAVLSYVDGVFDIQLDSDGDVMTADFFDTAIIVSLFTDRRADSSEVLEPHRRRGWPGEGDGVTGSTGWVYDQSRVTGTLLAGVSAAYTQALQWMVEKGYATAMRAVASQTAVGVSLLVTAERPNGQTSKRHFVLWEDTGVRTYGA